MTIIAAIIMGVVGVLFIAVGAFAAFAMMMPKFGGSSSNSAAEIAFAVVITIIGLALLFFAGVVL